MFLTMMKRSVSRGWRKKALAVLTVALGTSLAVATLNIAMDVGDKVNRELKSYGANILVTPQVEKLEDGDFSPMGGGQSFLPEDRIPQLKMIFWKHNIIGFAPYLKSEAALPGGEKVIITGTWFRQLLVIPTGETVTTGVRDIKSWWQAEGDWPDFGTNEAMVGEKLAGKLSLKPGDFLVIVLSGKKYELKIRGVLSSSGEEDEQVLVNLAWLQAATESKGKISSIEVSALTMPRNDLARKAELIGPDNLSRDEFETWYCSPFIDSVIYQIEEVIPGAWARPIRQITDSEGAILSRIQALMSLLSLAAAVISVLSISSLMGATALERSREIGLLKALGAHNSSVIRLFLVEACFIGVIGGIIGLWAGFGLGTFIGQSIFGTSISFKPLAIPAAFAVSAGVALLGSLSAARMISQLQPARILVGSLANG
ncbi:MAG: ABC transporter permease [Chloroflexi bacterium]|nr:ABC transporter permease [Chloroflexota bacterium]